MSAKSRSRFRETSVTLWRNHRSRSREIRIQSSTPLYPMRKTKSNILEAVHDTAKGLHKAGAMGMMTLREFDRLCLPPVEPLEPEQIKQIREASRVSRRYLPAC
ncbi:MAG: hypothetical protein Q8S20_03055 [Sulfuritalea sp.]|nr:hypothetical protein [Sulfuritalea sp.]